jgi:hypothetical protein
MTVRDILKLYILDDLCDIIESYRPYCEENKIVVKDIMKNKKGVSCLLCFDNRFAVGFYGGKIEIWDFEYEEVYTTIRGCRGDIMSLTYLGDNKIASISNDDILRIWDIENSKSPILTTICNRRSPLISYSDGKFAKGTITGWVEIFDSKCNIFKMINISHHYAVKQLVKFKDEKLVCLLEDGTIKIVDKKFNIQNINFKAIHIEVLDDNRVITIDMLNRLLIRDSDFKSVTVIADIHSTVSSIHILNGYKIAILIENYINIYNSDTFEVYTLKLNRQYDDTIKITCANNGMILVGSKKEALYFYG